MRRGGRPKISGKSFLWENKLDMKKGCNILKSSGTSAGLEKSQQHGLSEEQRRGRAARKDSEIRSDCD